MSFKVARTQPIVAPANAPTDLVAVPSAPVGVPLLPVPSEFYLPAVVR